MTLPLHNREIEVNQDKFLPTPRPPIDPWLLIADRVLRGEYNECDESTAKSLIIGLRGMSDEKAKRALMAIKKLHGKE